MSKENFKLESVNNAENDSKKEREPKTLEEAKEMLLDLQSRLEKLSDRFFNAMMWVGVVATMVLVTNTAIEGSQDDKIWSGLRKINNLTKHLERYEVKPYSRGSTANEEDYTKILGQIDSEVNKLTKLVD
jgi:hypothetical protein